MLPFSVFVLGGFALAVIMFGILAGSINNSDPNKTSIVYGVSLAVWIVAGGILACFPSLAAFILGFSLGAIIALILNPIALKYVWPANPIGEFMI